MSKELLGSLELNRIYQMDCLEGMKLISDKSISLIIADPPYNIGIAEWDNIDNYTKWIESLFLEWSRILSTNGTIYLYSAQQFQAEIDIIMRNYFDIKNRIIWTYDNGQRMSTKNFCIGYEPLFRATSKGTKKWIFNLDEARDGKQWVEQRPKVKKQPSGHVTVSHPHPNGRKPLDVWDIPRMTGELKTPTGKRHPSPKPLEICERIIRSSSNTLDTILVPFCGSGSECVAAKKLNRKFIGFEINGEYIELAKSRLDNLH